ncbi:MAG: T9SS type A sorting domain-containing protein [bacterium]|nr:T9SS type A sorting domain-containing protein [bacterium]
MKKHLLLALSFLLLIVTTNAQYYQIKISGGNPKGLNNDPEFPPGGGLPNDWATLITGTTSTTASWSADQLLPFNFKFNGSSVSTYRVSSSGVVNFSAMAPTVPAYGTADLSSATVPDNSLCVLGLGTTTATDYVVRKIFGTAPNRQLWIQFNSCTEPNLSAGWVYFSIVLEETSNNIYFVDQRTQCVNGTTICSNKTKLSVGIKVDNTNVFAVAGSPNYASTNLNDPLPIDNTYFMFIQGTQPTDEINLVSLNLPKFVQKNTNISIKGTISNYGSSDLTSFKLYYSVNGGTAKTMQLLGLNIAKNGGTYDFTHNAPYAPTAADVSNIKVWVSSPNAASDPNQLNDTLNGVITVLDKMVARRSVHEVFTSSTCPPCKPGNEKLDAVLNQRVGKFAVLKYQYYFPGNGDPYFTNEGYNRGTYYGGINSVPNLHVDGGWNNNPNSYSTTVFDQFQTNPSVVEMSATLNVTGQKADIEVSVTPVANMPTGNYKMIIALVEKQTVQNIKSNGETVFNFVMKKMLPNENGSTFTFPAKDIAKKVPMTFTFPGTFRLPSSARPNSGAVPTGTNYGGINLASEHNVEKFYDLQVVAFIQNDDTKEILQSCWTAQDWAVGSKETEVKTNSFEMYPNPTNGIVDIKLNKLSEGSVRVIDINGKELYNSKITQTESQINLEFLSSGMYFVEVLNNGLTSIKKLNIIK